MSVVHRCSVLRKQLLASRAHLHAQPAAGGTCKPGEPWIASLLPPRDTSCCSSSYAAAGSSTQVTIERGASCYQESRPAQEG